MQRGGGGQHGGFGLPGGGMAGGQARLAFGEGAGFVEGHQSDRLGTFERGGIAHQNAGPGGHAGADHDGGGGGEAHGAGARDDQHGDGVEDGGIGRSAEQQPDECGEGGDDDDHRHEDAAYPVREALDCRLTDLCVFHQAHHAGQHGFPPDGAHGYVQQAFAVDGAAGDGAARRFGLRHGFAGEQAFIDVAGTGLHDPIGG